ncbi:MAG: response regulator [Planctomycetaceae bacterium]|jgi:DNA-binding NtrC family response regulator|nr:response regulator [Planctomycetaceae bacterium]
MTIDSVKVLLNGFDWAWPQAVRQIFENRSVELLMVKRPDEALNVLQHRRVHTAIVDMDSKTLNGLSMIKIIRSSFPTLPCILLADEAEDKLLAAALELDVFSVMNKPVDIDLLQSQLNRLFVKRYDNYLFNS